MALNKKQKKQIDVAKKKIAQLRQRLSGAKQQVDDPSEITRLEEAIAEQEAQITRLKESS